MTDSNSDPGASSSGASSVLRARLQLILCSLLGIALFLFPLPYEGSLTIVLGVITTEVRSYLGENMRYFTLPIFVAGGIVAALYNLSPARIARRLPGYTLFSLGHWVWTVLALNAAVVASLMLLGIGPDWLIGKSTGVTAYVDVAGTIFLIIGFGCLFLPFLTDYGLLDLVGVMLRRPFQFVFRLPGRATVDTLASWVGASSIAVIMTGRQYERGFYTARESAVIATNFSVVSIPFVFFTAQIAGIPEMFFPLYGSMILVCFVCALVTPLLPPLSKLADEYYPQSGKQIQERVPESRNRLAWAAERAMATSAAAPRPLASFKRSFVAILEIFLTMMPASMSIEFLALVAYEHTPILQWLTWPLIGVLEVLRVPEAAAAAPGLVVGLFDQFVPAIIAGSLTAPVAKFVLAGLSLTQLIFFAESAILITRSAIPLSVPQLILIFAIRTVIALPMLAALAHMLY